MMISIDTREVGVRGRPLQQYDTNILNNTLNYQIFFYLHNTFKNHYATNLIVLPEYILNLLIDRSNHIVRQTYILMPMHLSSA